MLLERRSTVLLLAFTASSLLACSGTSTTEPNPSADYEGVWVSDDVPETPWVLELLPYDPYLPVLAGKRSVYRVWRLPEGQAPIWIEVGLYGIRDGGIELTPLRSTVGDQINHTYFHHLYDVDLAAGTMGVEAPGLPNDRRSLVRVPAFPGGSWTEGIPPHGDLEEPAARRQLVPDPALLQDVHRAGLFRTGEREALAVRAATFDPGVYNEHTVLDLHRTTDGGRAWVQDPENGSAAYGASEARFKEQVNGRPLVYPNDTLSEYLYLWSPELGTWEKDIDIEICRESAGFPDQDIVLTSWHGLAYSLCIADPEVVYVHRRRLDLNSFRIQYLQGPVTAVRGQWRPDEGPSGTLYGLVLTGGMNPAFRLYRHQEDDSPEFGPEQLAAPVAEIPGDCGELTCEVTGIWRYFFSGGEHHILALARFDGPAPAHPLAPEARLALYVHGTPEDGFTSDVLNVVAQGGGLVYLGDVADFDLPVDGVAGTSEPVIVLQDPGCLRVRRKTAGGSWEDAGVVPTAHRPAPDAALLWGDRLGMISADPAMEYLEFPLSADAGRCPPPRALP